MENIVEKPQIEPAKESESKGSDKQIVESKQTANITYANALDFRNILEVVNVVSVEPNFNVTAEGLTIREMDPSHVSMIDCVISKSSMDEYNYSNEFNFSMNLDTLFKGAFNSRFIKKEDSLKLAVNYGNIHKKAVITLSYKYKRDTEINLLEASNNETPSPKINFNATSKLDLGELVKIVDNASGYSDLLTITQFKDLIMFEANGDLGKFKVELDKSNEAILTLFGEEAKATYAINYLLPYLKALKKVTDIVTLNLRTDTPLKISAELRDYSLIDFYVAHRVGEQ